MLKNIKTLLLTLLLFFSTHAKKADLVAFSYNRPIQLYALLESLDCYTTGLHEVHVIYRSTTSQYENAYQEVMRDFPFVIFHKQGPNPRQDFKPLTLKATFDSPSEYIIFAVDDIIVKDFIDIEKSIDILKESNAYGFYFRLGYSLNFCYPVNRPQAIPHLTKIHPDVYTWHLKTGQYDWGYPHTVDMTLYRKKDIEHDLRTINYYAPNTLEGYWAGRTQKIKKENRIGLCHKETKIVNLPLNRVQNEARNRHMNSQTPKELLAIFNQGLKIDITPLFKIQNKSAHMAYTPSFIDR